MTRKQSASPLVFHGQISNNNKSVIKWTNIGCYVTTDGNLTQSWGVSTDFPEDEMPILSSIKNNWNLNQKYYVDLGLWAGWVYYEHRLQKRKNIYV